jgi:tRNA threonylcarbamoyl adenosine modification protein YeaZ
MRGDSAAGRLLAVDSGSPRVSVVVGAGGEVLASRSMERAQSSEGLLQAIADVLGEASLALSDLDGLIALAGPGSFTGLRVGLATLLGLHQASGRPAAALPTLDVLSLAGPAQGGCVTVVDALRGEWFARAFVDGEPSGPASLLTPAEIAALRPAAVVGPQADALRGHLPAATTLIETPELAPWALQWAHRRGVEWDPATLLRPLYLRPPAIQGRA